jgi:uncharacterized protein (DUF1778 family)
MPQITLRVTEEVYTQLQAASNKANLTLTDYLLSKALRGYLDDVVTVEKVLSKLPLKHRDEVFTLPALFSPEEWKNFSPGSRISTGRLFIKAYDSNKYDLKKKVEFLGKSPENHAMYKKLTND